MLTPRLSIVVPFYNVERYIADCLESLERQTFTDYEVLLVDDGSKDESVEVAREFCARDRRFRLITQENQGLGPARNTGVKDAQGDYLTFVDSDDLVPPHAYEIMVRSLDETASQIAAGNARRFNNTSGVRQSFVHQKPFAKDKPVTDVYEHPTLATDRMVWNKVYRRTFWDQFKYEFPAIRYEDYPITLRAYLDAITVDCLHAPVYYWRERESGESITQLKFQYGNLADRVTSAEMVLDLLKRAPELRDRVQKHLVQIDLATIVQAFASADDDELDGLIALGRRLSSRFDPRVVTEVPTLQRLEYEALQAGDAKLLRRLARFRAEGHGLVPARRHPALPWRYESQYPGLRDSKLPAAIYRLPNDELDVRALTTELEWTDDELVIHGTTEITHLATEPGATVRMSLVCGRRSQRLPVTLTEAVSATGEAVVGFAARVPRSMLAGLPKWASTAWVSVEMRSGLVRRKGELKPGPMQFSDGAWVAGRWIQPVRGTAGRLSLQVRNGSAELTGAAVDGDALVLTGRIPSRMAEPTLRLTRSAGDIQVPLQRSPGAKSRIPKQRGREAMDDFEARVAFDDLIDTVNPDDPFLGRTILVPRIHDGEDKMLLVVTGVNHGLMTPRGNRVISLTRSPGQYLNVVESPARVTADRIEVDGNRVIVSGPRWDNVSYDHVTWRRFLPNSDDGIDSTVTVTVDDERWSAEADVSEMDGGDEAYNWTLFADRPHASPYAVQTDSFLLTSLPLKVGAFTLLGRSGILHLETD
ncbi:glycosyltransferase [Actinoplanes sp. NPDC026619]|uniref:glycosyltransferase family 2 protein n=1 Tax=Actinoplanes sp. NPDC026619 TaxID=3155798 RepID=UPI0033D2A462